MLQSTIITYKDFLSKLDLDDDLTEMFLSDLELFRRVHLSYVGHKKRKQIDPGFTINEKQWIELWFQWDDVTKNYYFFNRGNKRTNYVMSRYNDLGPYTVENVFIQTSHANLTEPQVLNKISLKAKGKTKSIDHKLKIINSHPANAGKPTVCDYDRYQETKPKPTTKRRNHKRACIFMGHYYNSIKECHEQTSISRPTIIKRCKDPNWNDCYYLN